MNANTVLPIDGANPAVNEVTPSISEGAGGLPSANVPQNFSGFEITDELKTRFKDGKLNGRFETIDDVLTKLKEAEDFKANTIREQKSKEAQTQEKQTETQKIAQTQQLQQETIMEMLPEFVKNGMVLTPEMETRATEVGIDIRDLKLGAIDLREKTDRAHSIVGSSEEYGNMLAWAGQHMNDAQKKAFDVDVVNSNVSEYAIKGLYADYKKAQANGGVTTRIVADGSAIKGIQPYGTRQELYRDKQYVESAKGRSDINAINMYNSRKKITPDAVIFGR